jgi:hypothetical protein
LIVSPHGAVGLPWKVVKTERPGHDFVIELFDLGLGPERHVERHLERVTDPLFQQRIALERLRGECKFTLCVRRCSRSAHPPFEVKDDIVARLACFRVGVHLTL